MSAQRIVNLKSDVENNAAQFGLERHVETRLGRALLSLEHCGVSYQRLAPDYRLPFGHTHRRQEEVYVVIQGRARAKVGDQTLCLGPWDAVRIAPGTIRQFEAGPEGVEMLIVGAPLTGPEDDEIVPNWWTD